MRIAIIGTGNVGAALARGLKGKGHEIIIGTREREAEKVEALGAETGATIGQPKSAAAAAEVIILALPWGVIEAAVKDLGDLTGKIVIDCTNPLGMVAGALQLTVGHNNSGGELVQGWLPGAKVVKTLNQVGAEMMADNSALPHRPVMFMAGNDAGAKETVAVVLGALGFQALDAGDMTKARLLEPFAMVWINQALFRGQGRKWAFAAVAEG